MVVWIVTLSSAILLIGIGYGSRTSFVHTMVLLGLMGLKSLVELAHIGILSTIVDFGRRVRLWEILSSVQRERPATVGTQFTNSNHIHHQS